LICVPPLLGSQSLVYDVMHLLKVMLALM